MGQQGYSQITIDYINAPSIEQCRTNDTFTTLKLKSLPSIEIGDNKVWDFTSSTDSNVTFLAAYPVSGNPGFPEATFQTEVFYAFSQLRYDAALMLNVTQDGILRYGVSLKRQAIPLKGMTGGSLDSLIFFNQDVKYSSPEHEIKYPMTMGTKWTDSYSFSTNFGLTVALFGLNNVPGQRRTHYTTDKEVIGWGQMKVNDRNGNATKPIDVLLVKTTETAVDSFYLGGTLAPPQLLTAFGLAQNQATHKYNYSFIRIGEHYGLATIEYKDNSFKKPTFISVHQLRLGTTNSIENQVSSNITIFPNPVIGNSFNIKLDGASEKYDYVIYDISGKVINKGIVGPDNVIKLNENVGTGLYLIQLLSSSGKISVKNFQIVNK